LIERRPWHAFCCIGGMRARTLEELQVYEQSIEAAGGIIAILERPALRRDFELRDQLDRSSSRVGPLIGEGFGQQTDRHFASYLYRARGSCNEVRAHLAVAKKKKYIDAAECEEHSKVYEVIGKRLTRLIQHLRRENRKSRG
jgi:four helix bundle protein